MDLIATTHMRYKGRMLQPGEAFKAPRADAESLIATRYAKKDETAEEPEDPERRYKGLYRRRDMKAEH